MSKKSYGLFQIFFSHTRIPPFTLPYNVKKIVTKNPLNYYSLKVKQFHGDSVKNESAGTEKLQETPPTAC